MYIYRMTPAESCTCKMLCTCQLLPKFHAIASAEELTCLAFVRKREIHIYIYIYIYIYTHIYIHIYIEWPLHIHTLAKHSPSQNTFHLRALPRLFCRAFPVKASCTRDVYIYTYTYAYIYIHIYMYIFMCIYWLTPAHLYTRRTLCICEPNADECLYSVANCNTLQCCNTLQHTLQHTPYYRTYTLKMSPICTRAYRV